MDDDDDEIGIRDVDDEDYDDFEDGDEGDEEAVDEESVGEYEEEAEQDEDEREDTAARRRESEEYKSRRVVKLVAEVREFGEDIIDYNELAGIYDFPIDKFQVSFNFAQLLFVEPCNSNAGSVKLNAVLWKISHTCNLYFVTTRYR